MRNNNFTTVGINVTDLASNENELTVLCGIEI